MCCGSRMCMLCTCVVLVVVLVGFLFGFGVFKSGFHRLKDSLNACEPGTNASCVGPWRGNHLFAPPPF